MYVVTENIAEMHFVKKKICYHLILHTFDFPYLDLMTHSFLTHFTLLTLHEYVLPLFQASYLSRNANTKMLCLHNRCF